MKVTRAGLFSALEVETDEQEFPIYRRYRSDIWENLMGDSWETIYGPTGLAELETAFWEFMNKPGGELALSNWLRCPSLDLERKGEVG